MAQLAQTPGTFDEWYVKSSYQQFVREEDVQLYEGSGLEDLATLELANWKRRGGKAAYTRLGDQEMYGLQIVEIPPGGSLRPEHHMYEAIMYVMKGRGATTIWQEGEDKRTLEWQEGSLIAIPLNAWHEEHNGSGTEPCRFLVGTNMPQMINYYHNLDFVFNCPYVFDDRFSASMDDWFSDKGKRWALRMFESNFIADMRTLPLDEWKEKGFRTSIMRISMASTSIGMHISDVSEGTYVMAHRHGAGAHVIIVGGQGYELLYREGEEDNPRKLPLKPYGVVAPRSNEFHQHFNTGKGNLRMLAFRGGPARYGSGDGYDPVGAAKTDPNESGYKLEYEKENPRIREEYYAELEKNGVAERLMPVVQRG